MTGSCPIKNDDEDDDILVQFFFIFHDGPFAKRVFFS